MRFQREGREEKRGNFHMLIQIMARQSNYQQKRQPCLSYRSQREPGTSISPSLTLTGNMLPKRQQLTVTQWCGLKKKEKIAYYLICNYIRKNMLVIISGSKSLSPRAPRKLWLELDQQQSGAHWRGNRCCQLNHVDKKCLLITLLSESLLWSCLRVY